MVQSAVNPSNYEHVKPFPDGSSPERDHLVNIIVETPRGTRNKYAFDVEIGLFQLQKTIPEGLQWPYDYGFIPGTLGEDGDPLDVLFLSDEPTFPGCYAQGRLLGVIRIEKNKKQNDRLLACAKRNAGVSLSTDPYEKVDDLPKPMLDSLCRFLVEYAEAAGADVQCSGVDGRKKALQAIRYGIAAFRKRK